MLRTFYISGTFQREIPPYSFLSKRRPFGSIWPFLPRGHECIILHRAPRDYVALETLYFEKYIYTEVSKKHIVFFVPRAAALFLLYVNSEYTFLVHILTGERITTLKTVWSACARCALFLYFLRPRGDIFFRIFFYNICLFFNTKSMFFFGLMFVFPL